MIVKAEAVSRERDYFSSSPNRDWPGDQEPLPDKLAAYALIFKPGSCRETVKSQLIQKITFR